MYSICDKQKNPRKSVFFKNTHPELSPTLVVPYPRSPAVPVTELATSFARKMFETFLCRFSVWKKKERKQFLGGQRPPNNL